MKRLSNNYRVFLLVKIKEYLSHGFFEATKIDTWLVFY